MAITFEGPALMVRDMAACRAFYEGLLGQKVLFAVGEAYLAFENKFSLWDAAGARQMIFGDSRRPEPADPDAVLEMYFETVPIEDTLTRLRQAGVPFIHELREQPWGQRCFRVRDPEGRIVEIGEPMAAVAKRYLAEGQSVEDVARRTMLPSELVAAMASEPPK